MTNEDPTNQARRSILTGMENEIIDQKAKLDHVVATEEKAIEEGEAAKLRVSLQHEHVAALEYARDLAKSQWFPEPREVAE